MSSLPFDKGSHAPIPSGKQGFRRACALATLRNGTDIFMLAKLMGYKGIHELQRYPRQTNEDAEIAHRKASPVEVGMKNLF